MILTLLDMEELNSGVAVIHIAMRLFSKVVKAVQKRHGLTTRRSARPRHSPPSTSSRL